MESGTQEGAENVRPLLAKVPQALRELQISRSSFYAAAAEGKVKTIRLGKSIRIPWTEIERIAREGLPE